MATPESDHRANRDPMGPLTHPMRRRILRYLHRCGEPREPLDVATALEEALSRISYHLRSLASYGTSKEAGPTAKGDSLLYESAVSENADVLTLLEATETDDEGPQAAYKRP